MQKNGWYGTPFGKYIFPLHAFGKYIFPLPRPKFNMSTPNGVHQADLFLPHNSQGHGQGQKKSIYALTVVEAEP